MVFYNRLVEFFSRRRFNKQKGMEVQADAERKVVRLWPYTSKGQISQTCYLEVPVEQIGELIDKLQVAQAEAA